MCVQCSSWNNIKCLMILIGFMTTIELEMYQSVPSVEFNTYWIPCTWFISLLKEIKKGSRITDSHGLQVIMEVFLSLFNAVNSLTTWCSILIRQLLVRLLAKKLHTFMAFFSLNTIFTWIDP